MSFTYQAIHAREKTELARQRLNADYATLVQGWIKAAADQGKYYIDLDNSFSLRDLEKGYRQETLIQLWKDLREAGFTVGDTPDSEYHLRISWL